MERATNLTDQQISELRTRARAESGPFIDPSLMNFHPHNEEWASGILGHEFSGVERTTWPDLYLLYIACQAEPVPPPPPRQTARRAARAARQEAEQKRIRERHSKRFAQWTAVVQALPVRVEVRHNYTSSRHYEFHTQGVDHIYLLEDLHVGKLSRPAGCVLCWTPSRAKDLSDFPEPADDGRIPSCTACWKIASRLTEKAVPFLRGGLLHEGR